MASINPDQPAARVAGTRLTPDNHRNNVEDLLYGYLDKLFAWTTLTDAATIATDASLGEKFEVTLGGNRTLGAPTNPTAGQLATWRFVQDGTGSRTITLASGAGGFRFGMDQASIALSTAGGTADYMDAVYNADDAKWDVNNVTLGY